MKKLIAIIAIIASLSLPAISNAAVTPTSWLRDTVAGFLRPNITTDTLRIPSLTSCDTIDTDADGDLFCGTDDGGGGGSTALDLGDNGSNESSGLTEIATSGDINSIFSEPSADKLLINLALDWPKADQADALAANGSNCSAGSGALGVDASGAAESCTDFEEDLSNSAGLLAALSDETGTGVSVFNTLPAFLGFTTGNGTTSSGFARWLEDADNGSNYWQLSGPTSIASNVTCQIDASGQIPDSCVGDGTDDSGGATAFTALTDTFASYTGFANNFVMVNAAETALEPVTLRSKEIWVGNSSDKPASVTMSGDVTLANDGTATIGSDKILESMLKAVDTPADEEFLTYESTTGDFEWQAGSGGVPTTITVADTTDTTSFVGLFESATGDLGPKTDAGLTYNATTGMLTATGLTGPLTGNASTATALAADPTDCGANTFATTIAANGNLTCATLTDADVPNSITIDTATLASNVSPVAGTDATSFIAIFDSATGTQNVKTDTNLKWNATSNILEFDGPLQVGGNAIPSVSNSGALGTSVAQWEDLFLSEGGVINWDAGDATLTQTGNDVALAGASFTASTINVDLLDGVGAVDMDYGSVDITDHTFVTDGTGTAEIVLPDGSIDGTEILNDTVVLTTDTSGNYVSSATASGGLVLTGTEGGSLGVLLPAATDALSATTSSGSGLQLLASGLTLLQGCSDNQVLKWVESTDTWDCSTPSGSGTVTATGGSLTSNSVVLGAGTTDTKVSTGITTDGGSQLNLGVNATTLGKLKLFGSTSGDATIQTPAVAGTATVLTLPAATGTLATLAGTETLTNKTIASASNVLDACIPVAVTDEYSNLTTGTAKVSFRMPFAMTVTSVRASLVTVATGGTLVTVDINEAGTTILSTKLTFDASELTTTTAATAPVISDSALADDALMTVDIDAVGNTTPGNGLKISICGTI